MALLGGALERVEMGPDCLDKAEPGSDAPRAGVPGTTEHMRRADVFELGWRVLDGRSVVEPRRVPVARGRAEEGINATGHDVPRKLQPHGICSTGACPCSNVN